VQIARVAERAGVASGTVYRYFDSKRVLVAALVADVSRRELAAIDDAADASPGPLSALAAAYVTFAARALRQRRLIWAIIAEPVDAELAPVQRDSRRLLIDAFAQRIEAVQENRGQPQLDAHLLARASMGGVLEALLGPLAGEVEADSSAGRAAVQSFALYALRAAGIADARARGLVVQAAWPEADE